MRSGCTEAGGRQVGGAVVNGQPAVPFFLKSEIWDLALCFLCALWGNLSLFAFAQSDEKSRGRGDPAADGLICLDWRAVEKGPGLL